MNYTGNVESPTSTTIPETGKEQRIQRLDKAIAYYGSRKHVIFTVLGLVFGIIELCYGIRYLGQCPIQPMIAYFLTVHGAIMLFEVLIGILAYIISRVIYNQYDQVIARRLILIVIGLLILINLFCFAWFVAGNVWVFGSLANGKQSDDSTNLNTYCQSDLFRAALGIIISRYVLTGVIIIIAICINRRKIMRCCTQENISSRNNVASTPTKA
ncbi:unnamed protein product [Adineta ricciae]|uniref:Uncharacterized protein n=1 Tax=Adineta ricciae TaxID=249248 RepID=A0A813THR5_ADIRI|nr:unnamed protein product [Adineta ricciae]CAF1379908.1 unnamed protein product [Adineta ricciae]